jgi:ligand-binding sensor domain-containing protein
MKRNKIGWLLGAIFASCFLCSMGVLIVRYVANQYNALIEAEDQAVPKFAELDETIPYDASSWNEFLSNPHLGVSTTVGLAKGQIEDIALSPDGILWFATSGGVSSFDGKVWTTFTTEDGLVENHSVAIAATDGQVWVGHYSGKISNFDGTTWKTYEGNGSIIRSITIGKDGAVWFGTHETKGLKSGGVLRFYQGIWEIYTTVDGLSSNDISDMVIDTQGQVWCGTRKGLSYFNGKMWLPFPIAFPTEQLQLQSGDRPVLNLAIAPDNKIWMSVHGLGLVRVSDRAIYKHPSLQGFTQPRALLAARDGSLWVGGGAYGPVERTLVRFDGVNWSIYGTPFGIVFDILETADGVLWFGTERGVYSLTMSH